MKRWLADQTIEHLRDVAEWPDVGPRYEIKGRLGRGGMGVVYSALDRSLEREVAVKVIDDVGRSNDPTASLLREATILARLEHPGIVPVHDAGTLADGRVFYVMKRVRGARLEQALAARESLGERLDVFLKICETVSFAHARGIVHRDLKPENVMVGAFGEVLVMDWGVATSLDTPGGEERVVAGTPGFMSPEQESTGAADQRADIFALGAMLAAILPSPLPKPLKAIVDCARAGDPGARYGSVEALAKDIVRFREGAPVSAHRETIPERLARTYRRYRVPILLVFAYMAMRAIMLMWLGV
jgi:serine/threonine protein kinase